MPGTTVLGVARTRGFLPDRIALNASPNNLCRAVDGEIVAHAKPAIVDGEPGFSKTRSSRERKVLTIHSGRCRRARITTRILSGKSESILVPSHSVCGCTTYWRGTSRALLRPNGVLIVAIVARSNPLLPYFLRRDRTRAASLFGSQSPGRKQV